jgi:hypothetical protein
MPPKQLARHPAAGTDAAVTEAPVHRPIGQAQHRAGLIPPSALTWLLAGAVVFALAIVAVGVAGR